MKNDSQMQQELLNDINMPDRMTDDDIASDVVRAFKWNWEVPADKLRVSVANGCVTLEGEVQWKYQRDAANLAVRRVPGVKTVSDQIRIRSHMNEAIGKTTLESALETALSHNGSVADKNIRVKVSGHTVSLSGSVDSAFQKEEAAHIAWKAPGVWDVDNKLVVEYRHD